MSDAVEGVPVSRGRRIADLVLPRLVFYPLVVASLLAFPAAVPVMILGWLLLFAHQRRKGKPAWRSLLFCLLILLIKRVDWSPALIVLGLLMAACAALECAARKKPAAIAAIGLVPAWIVMSWTWSLDTHTSRTPALAADRPIVCLGDSLSAGGLARALDRRLSVPVIDKAQGGITAAEGLKLIPDALSVRPQAVILELGGHDYLRNRTRGDTKANLEKLIRAIRDSGAEVILVEIPRGFVSDPFWGLDRRLARAHDLELVTDGAIRQLVIFSPAVPLGWTGRQLSYDGLHPNDAGNEFLADRIRDALHRVYGDAVLRRK